MKFGKRLGIVVLIGVLFLNLLVVDKPALASSPPEISGTAGILVNMNTGKVIWSKNPDEKLPLASTTKILTGVIALEKGNLHDEVTVSENAIKVDGTRVYLKAGEKQTLENLLYAMLLNSANDAAYAIAEHIGGSIDGFAKLMNARAQEIGARNSHFVNPNGLTADEHYTTARDLALIAQEAMKNKTFRTIVATKTRAWNGADWQSVLRNQNKLLFQSNEYIGVKTGYTTAAKNCLVAAKEKNNDLFLAVVLGSTGNVFNEAKSLLDYASNNYYTQSLASKNQAISEIQIKGQKLKIVPKDDVIFLQAKDTPFSPDKKVIIDELKLPIKKGQVVGRLELENKNKIVGSTLLIANNDIKKVYGIGFFCNILAYLITFTFILYRIRKFVLKSSLRKKRIFCR